METNAIKTSTHQTAVGECEDGVELLTLVDEVTGGCQSHFGTQVVWLQISKESYHDYRVVSNAALI